MKKVKFNRYIYSDQSILKTIQVYKNHALIKVDFQENYAIINFLKCKYNENQTIKEFENYMIGIENS